MQIALHDIRRIGYKKIFSYFIEDFDYNIIDEIKNLNSSIYSYDDSAFSVLNNWGSAEDIISSDYFGFYNLVNNYTPMVSEVGAETITKRKFRNTWQKMWTNISKDMEIPEDNIKILADCGIRLVHYLYNSNLSKEDIAKNFRLNDILKFYNVIFKWTIFSDKELNFKKNDMTHIDVLELISLKSPNKFCKFMLKNVQ